MLSPIVKRIAGSSPGVARDRRRIDIQSYGDDPKRFRRAPCAARFEPAVRVVSDAATFWAGV